MKKKNIFEAMLDRRDLLKQLGLLGASVVVSRCVTTGAGGDEVNGSTAQSACAITNSEEAGPFPADGTNDPGDGNPEVLDLVYPGSPIIRSNIRETQMGIPLTLIVSLQDVNNSCEPVQGYFIYIWHCTQKGEYSAYKTNNGSGHERTETYLRGIVETDVDGYARFITIYPGWYNGRAVHIHAEIYKSLSDPSPVLTTQFSFPSSINDTVQQTGGYKGLTGMLQNSEDPVFADGTSTQMLTLSGSMSAYTAGVTIRVPASEETNSPDDDV